MFSLPRPTEQRRRVFARCCMRNGRGRKEEEEKLEPRECALVFSWQGRARFARTSVDLYSMTRRTSFSFHCCSATRQTFLQCRSPANWNARALLRHACRPRENWAGGNLSSALSRICTLNEDFFCCVASAFFCLLRSAAHERLHCGSANIKIADVKDGSKRL